MRVLGLYGIAIKGEFLSSCIGVKSGLVWEHGRNCDMVYGGKFFCLIRNRACEWRGGCRSEDRTRTHGCETNAVHK